MSVRAGSGSRRRLRRPGALGLAAALLALPMVSCSTDALVGSTDPDAPGRALARLERMAERRGERPTGAADDLPPPPFQSMVPVEGSESGLPQASLRSVIDELIGRGGGEGQATDRSVEPTAEDHRAALGLYAESRQHTAAGQHARAIRLLEQASELDPASPEIWRALGDARRGAGFSNSAGAAFVRAGELGIAEPEALTLAGLHASAQGDPDAASSFLAGAVTATPPHTDPLVLDIAYSTLGGLLLDQGRTRAGCDALERGLGIPGAARVPTNLGAEAVAIRRQLADLYVRLGDARSMLGEHARAASAYRRASEQPGGRRPEFRARLVYALRASGQPEAAALVLIEDLRSGATLTPDTRDVLAGLAGSIRPRLAVADAISSIDTLGSPTRSATLLLARAAAMPDPDARALLVGALTAPAESPVGLAASTGSGRDRLTAALLERTPDSKLVSEAASMVSRRPGLAGPAVAALRRAASEPRGLPGRITEEAPSGAAELMLAEHALAVGVRAAQAESLERLLPVGENTTPPAAERLETIARLAAALGRWERYEDALSALRREAAGSRSLATALEAGQRFDEAFPIAQRLADEPDATVDDLLRVAALGGQVDQPEVGLDALERAEALDPHDERVYNALLAYTGPSGVAPNQDRRTSAARSLQQRAPGGPLIRRMVSAELIRRGLLDDASTRLTALFREDPTDPQTLEAMLALWTRLDGAERGAEIDLGPARDATSRFPASSDLARLVASGLLLLDRPQDAADEIAAFESRTGSPLLARMREKIIAEPLGDPERAERLALERLDPAPRSIEESLELATLHASRLSGSGQAGATDEAGRLALINRALQEVPTEARLTGAQRAAIAPAVNAVGLFARTRTEQGGPRERDDALAILDWGAGRRLALAPVVHDARLTLRVESGAGADEIARTADDAVDAHPQSTRAIARRVIDLLLAQQRPADAEAWIRARAFGEDGTPDADVIPEWARFVVMQPDPGAARTMITDLGKRDALAPSWRLLRGAEAPDDRDTRTEAEFAYLLAQYAAAAADPDGTPRFLRLALEYDPRHPWACNDLGYRMLETAMEDASGTDHAETLAESERLIAIAYEQLPDEAAIVDSLGWVRYHLDHLEDREGPDGGDPIPGAVSLLRRAVELAGNDDDGVVADHLGDALYRSGRSEEAVEAWGAAARQASRILTRLRASGQAGGIRSREIQQLASAAAMKRNAVQLGEPAATAPQLGVPPDPARGTGRAGPEPNGDDGNDDPSSAPGRAP